MTEEMSSARQARVMITNLPRGSRGTGNSRNNATVDEVLMLYLGQYRIERASRIAKSAFEIDSVYIHRPLRANAFMFVISLA